jgi:hypothetical protein
LILVGNHGPLYRLHEIAIRALYAEVKERANSAAELLSGTPGSLVKRAGTGHEYWYRSYYPAPNKRSEQFVGTVSNAGAYEAMQVRIAHSEWTTKQVAALSKFGYRVADKIVASVLVELHNRGAFKAGMVVLGNLAYSSWLNEFGAIVARPKTQEPLELARRQALKLASKTSLLATLQATQLPFAAVPEESRKKPATALMLSGGGLRVELFAPGPISGEIVFVPELEWHALAVPFYDYLLEGSRDAGILAGGHCVPVMLPDVTRMIWFNLYASTRHRNNLALAEKDLAIAATLAAILVETDGVLLRESYREAPRALRNAAHARLPRLEGFLAEHARARDEFRKLR